MADGGDGELLDGAGNRGLQRGAGVLGAGLDHLLRQPVGLARRLGELLRLIGDELAARLEQLGLERLDGRLGLDELALVHGELSDLRLVLLQRVDDQGARQRATVVQGLAHVGALLGEFHQPLARLDGGLETHPRRILFRDLRRHVGPIGGELSDVGRQHALLAKPDAGADAVGERHGARFELVAARDIDRDLPTNRLGARCLQIAGLTLLVGTGFGRVELDQHVAGRDHAAVLDHDGRHLARLQRLHDLGATRGLDAPLRDGVDVELADVGPQQRRHDAETDDP